MTPDNAQPPVTAQRVREIGLAHITACCPDPKYACGNCTRETAELNAVADQLEQHERELAALRQLRDTYEGALQMANATAKRRGIERDELRRDRDAALALLRRALPFTARVGLHDEITAALATHKPEASKEDGA